MDYCTKSSNHNFAWQSTLEGILSNLKGEFEVANHTNALGYQPLSKELSTEALFMLYVILLFVLLAIIGSSINVIEFLCKEFRKEIRFLIINEKEKSTNAAAYTGAKQKTFKPAICAGIKSRDINIYHIKQILREGLHLACKMASKNDIWGNCKKYLECFSVQINGRKLLSIDSGEEQLNSLHGIKVLSLIWVCVSHICMFHATIIRTVTDEFQYILEVPVTQIILNGIFANDVFFVLSGFLNGYMFFDYYKKRKGKIPWLLYYLNRFFRLTPMYLIILGFYATLFSYTDSGPLWPTFNTNPVCKQNWIWNVLYLNNFIAHNKQCMLTTWYIACDLQLYIISPIFLLLLMRKPKFGFSLLVMCVCGSCVTAFILTKHFQLIDGISKLALHSRQMAAFYGRFWVYFDMIYDKPYTRIGSYLVGIALGYLVFQRKFSGSKSNSLVTLSLGWMVSIVSLGISFFAIYNRNESLWETAVYNGVKDLLCSCSISWIIFVCVTGQGGLINTLLSIKLFVPFSRLSYCFYFIHILVIEKYFLSIDELTDFNLISAVFLHIRLQLWAWAVSFMVSLIFERPLLNLVGLLLRKEKPEQKLQ